MSQIDGQLKRLIVNKVPPVAVDAVEVILAVNLPAHHHDASVRCLATPRSRNSRLQFGMAVLDETVNEITHARTHSPTHAFTHARTSTNCLGYLPLPILLHP